MAFSDFESSDLKSTATPVIPTNGWHIEILSLPINVNMEEIQMLFTKYGAIDKVAIIYKVREKSLNCYLSYERESDSVDALKENGKKVGVSSITVIKYSHNSDGDKGNKRLRTEDTCGGWGSTLPNTTNNSDNGGGWGSSDTPASDSWGGGITSSPGATPWGGGGRGGSRGGRGGGGGGGGRGGGRSCFKCGDEGHMSRECPKGGGGGGGSRACFKCGEEGHMSRECPKGGGGGGGSRACFKCGEEGHMSRECPKGGGRGCFNCGEEGHMSRECSQPRRGRGGGRGGGNGGNRGNGGTSEWGTTSQTSSSANTDWD